MTRPTPALENLLTEADRLLKGGKAAEALSLYSQAIREGASSFAAYHNGGLAALSVNPLTAADLLRRALAQREDASAHHHLAVALALQGRMEESLPHFRRAVDLDPRFSRLAHPDASFTDSSRARTSVPQACLLCGNDAPEFVFVGNSSRSHATYGVVDPVKVWVRCRVCGLVYANPRPSDAALKDYYREFYLDGGEGKRLLDGAWTFISLNYERVELIEDLRGGRTGAILDVGSSLGLFLAVARDRGWHSTGLEISPPAADYARRTFGIPVIEASFEDHAFPETTRFDVVTLWEVIEHLTDPLAALKKAYRVLHDDGLIVLGTPNVEHPYHLVRGYNDPMWDVPVHLTYFSKESLTKFLHLAGFRPVAYRSSKQYLGSMEVYARKVPPTDPACLRAQAQLHIYRNDLDEAERLLRAALAADPSQAGILNDLGVVAYHHGEEAKARAYFEAALEADPDHVDARANLEALGV